MAYKGKFYDPRFDSRLIDFANRALDFLDRRYSLTSTSTIVKNCGLATADQRDMRTVLDMLFVAGAVDKDIVGRHSWKSKHLPWDRDGPFAKRAGAEDRPPPDPTSDSEPDRPAPAADPEETAELRRKVETLSHKVEGLDALAVLQQQQIEHLTAELAKKQGGPRTITVQRYDGTELRLKEEIVPACFKQVQELGECRRNVLLVGPAGCGKTTIARLLAKVLGLEFGKVGGSAGLTEVQLLGKARPNVTTGKDRFQTTPFLRRYEEGGVCLVDEIDAADPNALLALNAALDDSGRLPVPNREDGEALKNPDFVCVATANTSGRGANRVYVGRNQLDEATLDRFRIGVVEVDYDPAVEEAVCPSADILEWGRRVRRRIEEASLRRVLSTRFLADAHLMRVNRDWTLDRVKAVFFSGWSREEVSKVSY